MFTPHSLTVDSTLGGSVTKPGEGIFACAVATEVDLLAVAEADYAFCNWTGDERTMADVNSANTTITICGDYCITANFALCGDADGDGDVDVFDWVRVRRILMGLDPPTCGADADTDGDVDVFDWVRVRRILMGL
ncbi:MAG: hypothetical protein WBC82_06790 [Dehalococcoidia bacterium]